jgi:hypothetical protein
MKNESLSKLWWLWVPVGGLLIQACIEALPEALRGPLMSERGPHELLQAAVAFLALLVAVITACRFPFGKWPYLGAWILLAAGCCLYVTGEELSWGQQLVHWRTPEDWSHINDQNETNLHNTSSWLDQKPRLLLEIGISVGGLIIPLLKKFKPLWVPQRFEIIYPPAILGVVAGLNLFVRFTDAVASHIFHFALYERASEVQELYMYYFVLLYLIVLKKRINNEKIVRNRICI